MAFKKQKSEKNLKAKYLRMWKFKILFLKVEFDFDLLSLLCKFDENLSTKVALVTNGLTKMYCTLYWTVDIYILTGIFLLYWTHSYGIWYNTETQGPLEKQIYLYLALFSASNYE